MASPSATNFRPRPFSISKGVLKGLPAELAEMGFDIEFQHAGPGLGACPPHCRLTIVSYDDHRRLLQARLFLARDPSPHYLMSMLKPLLASIRTPVEEVRALFITCSDAIVAAAADLLNEKTATASHVFIPMAMKDNVPSIKVRSSKESSGLLAAHVPERTCLRTG